MYMLDTDTCSYIIRERPDSARQKFNRIDPARLCISIVTRAELLYGVARSSSKNANREIVDDFCSRLSMLNWDEEAARHYGQLRSYLESKGTLIGSMDMMIAAHALSLSATLVTNNLRHFSLVPKLKAANWVR